MEWYNKIVKSLSVLVALTISPVFPDACTLKDQCSCEKNDGSLVQLKYLAEYIKEQSVYLTTSHEDSISKFNFNPCIPFTVQASKQGQNGYCNDVVACQHHPELYDIGSLTFSTSFSLDEQGDVKITYVDASGATYYGSRKSEVTCICDTGYTGIPLFTSQGEQTDPSMGVTTFFFKMRHLCCCSNKCKDKMPTPVAGSGLSGGSVLLIVALVLVVVYIVIGGLFMKYKRGAIGTEMIPNKSFWSALPLLVKDGVMFVLAPCTKRGSYTQV